MRISEPVMLVERSPARKTARSATSCGVVNRPVAEPATTDSTTSSGVAPLAAANCRGDAVVGQPQIGRHRAGADRVHANTFGAEFL